MPTAQTIALIQTAFVLILVLFIDTFVTLRRVVARLKAEHHVLWVSLGCPEAFSSLMASRGDFYANLTGKTTLTSWLSQGEYLHINDPIITRLARRRKIDKRATLVIVIAFILMYAWFHRYD